MSEEITEILAICLERMEAGDRLESCLADFPHQAAQLEPLLRMTHQMKPLANVGPRPMFARTARLKLENELATSRKAVTFARRSRHTKQEPRLLLQRRFGMSVLQLVIAAVLTLTATTGGVAYAANASGPGDVLHGLDLAMENTQLHLASDVSTQVQLRLQFASERLAEAQTKFAEEDVTDGLEAVNEYGSEISAIAQLIGSADGADQEQLAALLEAAQGIHQDVLTQLLDKVPDQAKEAIQSALDASNHTGQPEGTGKPEGVGKPDETGKPEGVGNPDGTGKPEGVGNPNNTGNLNNPDGGDNPNGSENSNGVAGPGVDISACANSLSQENAQALAGLAKQQGVDYQYVLQNFCVLGTIEQVQEMISGMQAPPTDVPAGPPSNTPAGPPSDHPGRP